MLIKRHFIFTNQFKVKATLNELRLPRITLNELIKFWEFCPYKVGYKSTNNYKPKTIYMLRWTVTFIILAIIAGIFGFGGIAAGAAGIAKILFFIFLVLFIISLITGRRKI